ncbi:MAG: tetratricopeptide repeat protein [Flavobacteriales bacterium]
MRTFFWPALVLSVFSCMGQQPPPTPAETKNIYLIKADKFASNGDLGSALEMLNKADSISPGDSGLLNLKAQMKNRLGDHAGAIMDLDRAIGSCTDQKQCRHFYMTRAEVHKAAGQMELACRDWKLAGAWANPTSPSIAAASLSHRRIRNEPLVRSWTPQGRAIGKKNLQDPTC